LAKLTQPAQKVARGWLAREFGFDSRQREKCVFSFAVPKERGKLFSWDKYAGA
jgi:hypothetical protein